MQADDTGAPAPTSKFTSSGCIRGQLSAPTIEVVTSPIMGFVAVATDARGNRLSCWAATRDEAEKRAILLWAAL